MSRRLLSVVAAVIAIAAVALLALLLWPSGGAKGGISDRARAAVGDGRVLHVITRTPIAEQLVSLRTGRTIAQTYEVETWSDRSSRRFHDIVRRSGRVINEDLTTQPASGAIDPSSIWAEYRQGLASGKANLERSGRLYGQDVYWLRFPLLRHGLPGSEVAVDRRTYRPLAFRFFYDSGGSVTSRVLLARTEGFSPADFRRRTAPNGPTVAASYGTEGPAGPPEVTKPWLRAGSAIAGVRLSSAQQLKMTLRGRTWEGIELVYGRGGSPFAAPLVVDEVQHPDSSAQWWSIPRGFIRIDEAAEPSPGHHLFWIGQLVRNGTYVTIRTRISRAAVLEAARSLRPV